MDYTTFPTTPPAGGGSFDWDWSSSNFWKWSPNTSGSFTINFTNVPSSYTFAIQVLTLEAHPAGITWPTIIWAQGTAPTLTSGKKSLITLSTCDGGTTIYGTFIEST